MSVARFLQGQPPRASNPAPSKPLSPDAYRLEVEALCAVADLALTWVAERGLQNDDRPDFSLATVRRWCRQDTPTSELHEAGRLARQAREEAPAQGLAAHAYACIDWLTLLASDDSYYQNSTGVEEREQVFGYIEDHAAKVLLLDGETLDAAQAHVAAVREQARQKPR